MTVQHFAADASVDDVAAAVSKYGCAIIDELLDLDTVEKVRGELAPYVDRHRRTAPGTWVDTTMRKPASPVAHAILI